MNTFKSLFLGSLIRVSSLHKLGSKRLATVSHIALTSAPADDLASLTYKQLKALCTARKIKGRSKLTTKAKMIAALRKV